MDFEERLDRLERAIDRLEGGTKKRREAKQRSEFCRWLHKKESNKWSVHLLLNTIGDSDTEICCGTFATAEEAKECAMRMDKVVASIIELER